MLPRSLALLAVLLLLLAPVAHAEGSEPAGACAERVADRVQARYEGVRDLEASFTQRSTNVALGPGAAPSVTRGRVVFAKPGRMRWEYQKPEPSLVVSDGSQLWIVDPREREAQVLPVGKAFLSGTAIEFLLGQGHLREAFQVTAEGCGTGSVRLHLKPRKDATYEHLELLVNPATGEIHQTVVVDLFGNRTEVDFADVRTNTSPAADRFRYQAPPDYRVVKLPPQ